MSLSLVYKSFCQEKFFRLTRSPFLLSSILFPCSTLFAMSILVFKIQQYSKYRNISSWFCSKFRKTQNANKCLSWSWSKYRITQNTKILSKAQRTQGLSALAKVTAFKSYYKLNKIQPGNLDQNSAPKKNKFQPSLMVNTYNAQVRPSPSIDYPQWP